MKTENTNDFSKRKIGDKLWSIQLGDCVVSAIFQSGQPYPIKVANENGVIKGYTFKGLYEINDYHQSLFFSNPNIIAPPEPVRFPDYKPGQWIAVWEQGCPIVRKFARFDGSIILCTLPDKSDAVAWSNHCTLEELPEVLAKWGEKK